ncbi:hypothetical protein GMSM_34050 [Geomonas sp. Red276]
MKKTLVVASMLALLPCAAHAKTMINDSALQGVTGQAGVSIDVDARFDVNADAIGWGQDDGSGKMSWIGMKNFKIDNLTVKLRPDVLGAVTISTLIDQLVAQGMTEAQAVATLEAKQPGQVAAIDAVEAARQGGATTAYFISQAAPMRIDVLTADSATGNKAAGTTYVRIGLGSFEIAANSIDFTVALGNTTNHQVVTSSALAQELGSMHLGNMVMDLNGSSKVDIYAANQLNGAAANSGSGVVFDLDVTVDKLTAAALSWGNTAGSVTSTSGSAAFPSGAQTSTTAGYVGLANMNIAKLHIVGPLSIKVATVDTSDAGLATAQGNLLGAFATGTPTDQAQALANYYYALYGKVGMGSSFVHIGLGTGSSMSASTLAYDNVAKTYSVASGALGFTMGSFIADVKVADNNNLTGGGTYGTMGINQMAMGMNGWVNIGTH